MNDTTPTELQKAFTWGLTCGAVLTLLSGAVGLYVGSCTLNTRPTTDVFSPPSVVLQGTLPDPHHDEDSGP